MTAALLVDDPVNGELVAQLLARFGIRAAVLRRPRPTADVGRHLDALRAAYPELITVGEPALPGARSLTLQPSLATWLTRDTEASLAVLGTTEVPTADDAEAWLSARMLPDGRRYAAAVDGRELAARVDLRLVAACSAELRTLLAALRPAWATDRPIKRGRGRPRGVQLFQGSGYALCLELLERGERAETTTGELVDAVGRTKTPVLRMIQEAERRGYLRRSSPRGPLQVRGSDRLLEDLVTSVRAEAARQPAAVVRLRSDRDPGGLPARVSDVLAELGVVLAVTGAAALADVGGDLLVGAPVRAYAAVSHLKARSLADAYPAPHNPTLLLVEPPGDAVFHRLRPGTPARVSRWQALIDLLASDSEREREVGEHVRRRLERR